MDLHFYLNNVEVKLAANSSITEILDETRDSGSATLEYNNSAHAVLPMTPFKIVDNDSGETLSFHVITDTVEKVSKTLPLYSHTITFTENTVKLDSIAVRNSVFSKSINLDKKIIGYCNFSGMMICKQDTTNQTIKLKDNLLRPAVYENTETNTAEPLAYDPLFQLNPKTNYKTGKFKISSSRFCFRTINGLSYSNPYPTAERDVIYQMNLRLTRWEYDPDNDNWTEVDHQGISYDNYQGGAWSSLRESMFTNRTKNTYYRLTRLPNPATVICTNTTRFPNYTGFSTSSPYYIFVNVNVSLEFDSGTNYSLYHVLEELRLQALKTYNGENSVDPNKLFNLPVSGDDYDTLTSVPAPTFSFEQKTLYQCVAEIFNYIDAIPTIDKDNVLHIEYFNDYNRDKTTAKFNEKNSILNLDGYSNRLVAEYQNGRKENALDYPAKNMFRGIAAQTYGVVGKDDYILPVSSPIDFVDKLTLKLDGGDATVIDVKVLLESGTQYVEYSYYQFPYYRVYTSDYDNNGIIDVTPGVFEEKQYNLLPYDTNADNSFPNRFNTIYYTQGSNFINIGDITDVDGTGMVTDVYKKMIRAIANMGMGLTRIEYNQTTPYYSKKIMPQVQVYSNRWEIRYNVKYHGIYDGKVAIENRENKYEGEKIVSQTAGQPQMNRMGINMQGLLQKMGNERYTCAMELTSFDQRVKKGQIWVDSDGNKYIANSVKTTFSTSSNKVYTEIEFIKNYNELSIFTKLDSNKRFYEIDQSLISKGYEFVTEYLYFTTDISYADVTESNTISSNFVKIAFFDTLLGNDRGKEPSMAIISTTAGGIQNDFGVSSDMGFSAEYVASPINSYGFGNMLCYEFGFENAVSAGDIVRARTQVVTTVCSQPVLYTDKEGNADTFTMSLRYISKNTDLLDYYPLVEDIPNTSYELIKLNNYNYRKRPNEIFRFNFEIACLPYNQEEIFFGDSFIAQNAGISNTEWNGLTIWTSDTYEYSIIDKIAQGTKDTTATVSENHSVPFGLTINLSSSRNIKSWCLADRDGNIYIAGNFSEITTTDTFGLYVFSSRTRQQ